MKHFEKMMGGGKRYTPPMIEISTISVEGAFAMSKDNVKADAFHQRYYIDALLSGEIITIM